MHCGKRPGEVAAWGIDELIECIAFHNIEPFTDVRGDLQAGIIAAAVVNSQRGRGRALRPVDFMPDFDGKRSGEIEPERAAAILKAFVATHNARIKKR